MKTETKKTGSSTVGCVIYLIIAGFLYYIAPSWQFGVGYIVASFFIAGMLSAISNEWKMIGKRKATNTSTISQASNGYVELEGRLVQHQDFRKSWFAGEEVGFIHFVVYKRKYTRNKNSFPWETIYQYEPERKKMLLADGSGQCWISLYNADVSVSEKTKNMSKKAFTKMLDENPIPDFPMEKLEGVDTIRVWEQWMPTDKFVYAFGNYQSLPAYEAPTQFLDKQPVDKPYQEEIALNEQDWQSMTKFEANASTINLLSANYDAEPIEQVIVSNKEEKVVNAKGYFTIGAMIFGIIFIIGMAIFITLKEFPDFMSNF